MAQRLIDKVATGVAWSSAEKLGSMLLQMVVSIVVARLLSPEDFGVMAILTFFTALSLVVVDSGFSQTLIRKEAPTPADYRSVFTFNIAVSLLLYAVLTLTAPLLARFYGLPIIADIAPVLFLLLPINALCVIQNTIFTREFRFAALSKITFAANLVAGVAAIAAALCGWGVWSLVVQRLTMMTTRALLLWRFGTWQDKGQFSGTSLRQMAPFSLRLMSTDIIAAVYTNVAQLFIGKIHSASDLGFFNQAQKIKDLPVTSAMMSVQSVTYPALSNIRHDVDKFAESYRKVLAVTAFVMLPAMLGLVAIAEDMFMLLLGAKWLPTVPYFRILAFGGIFYPLSMLAYNVLKVYSNGSIILRLEILKRIIMTIILAVTIPHSIEAVAYGLTAMSAIDLAINLASSLRYTTLSFGRIVRSLLPSALLGGVMMLAIELLNRHTTALPTAAQLSVAILAGGAIYIGGATLLRLEAWREICDIAKRMLRRGAKS